KIFCLQLEDHAKRMHESDIEKSMREKKIQDQKEFDLTLAGTPIGEFEEMGVIVDDSRDRNTSN
ncbi:MAG TPA: hypothetical protein VIY47_08160, partial [Ignavibacteriaceae bacterium]